MTTRRTAWHLGACAIALLVGATFGAVGPAAGNDESPAPVSITAVVEGKGDVDSVILIGRSGQAYMPQGSGSWKRDGVGGVSVDVGAATMIDKKLYVAGERTPLFKKTGGVWSAHHLPNRGEMTVGVGGSAPVIGIRSHIYTITQKRWKRIAATGKGSITAIWASTNQRVYVGTSEGEIKRFIGKASNKVTHTLAKDDTLVGLYGAPGKELYGVSKLGVVLAISAKTSTVVSIPDALAGLVVQVAGAAEDGTVWIAGTAGTDPAKPVLAQLSKSTLTLAEELPALDPDDHFTVVYAGTGGGLLVATAAGVVRIRAEDGTWSMGTVDGSPPESPEFAHTAPAHTR